MANLIHIDLGTYYLLADKASRFSGVFGTGQFNLAEAFPIWTMQPDKWNRHTFYATGRWHFQVKTPDKKAIGYMHAIVYGPRSIDWEIVAAFNSTILANGVDSAMRTIDDLAIEMDGEARIVINPSYQVTALWIHNGMPVVDRFAIAYSPNGNDDQLPDLLTMDAFFTTLREMGAIQGRNHESTL